MRRRDLLTLGLAAPLVLAGGAFATPQARERRHPRLLVVFLRGAYDSASLLVPVSSDFYYRSRPSIAIARPNPADPNAAIPLTAEWGLHPALAPSILPVWTAGQLALVPFAGTDDMSRSHFETQDTIELGQPIHGSRNFGSGFLSRLTTQISGPGTAVGAGVAPIAFTQQTPISFQGGQPIPNVAINGMGKPGVDDRQARLISDMYRGTALAPQVTEGFEVDRRVYQTISGEMTAASRGAVNAKGFELAARRIGRLMRDQFDLAFVDVGGWDTHVGQGAGSGYLAGRLGELGRGLAGFADEIGSAAWNDTTVVVISEFGRTFRENGNKGTDHGHGSVYWVMGGAVKGGRVTGDAGPVTETSLNQNRDYPVLVDYRGLLGGLFRRLYGLNGARLDRVFPSAAPVELGLV
jgi:uncharacterized protein (DUF1501 family)